MRNDTVTSPRRTAGALALDCAGGPPCSAMHAPRRRRPSPAAPEAIRPPQTCKRTPERALQALDQARVDEQAIEAPRLRTGLAAVEQAVAALHDLLLLDECRIERQPGGFLNDERKI